MTTQAAEHLVAGIKGAKTWLYVSTAVAATAVLLVLLFYDFCKAVKNRMPWVPARALLLNALCLTLLGLVLRPLQELSEIDDPKLAVGEARSFEVLLLGDRVMMCVFTGYLLPTIGKVDKAFSGDMVALLIGLVTTFYKLFLEAYTEFLPNGGGSSSMAIKNSLVMVSMVQLVWLLGCAVQASVAIQDIASLKLSRLINNCSSVITEIRKASESLNHCWEHCRGSMLGLCITARSFEPRYVIARSVLASSTFFAVTISSSVYFLSVPRGVSYIIAISKQDLNAAFENSEEAPYQGSRFRSLLTLFLVWVFLQCSFILCGWSIICHRWLHSIVYCSVLHPQISWLSQMCQFFRLQNFWLRAPQELQENCQLYVLEHHRGFRLFRKMLKISRLHKLFRLGLTLQAIAVWYSKACLLISKVFLFPELVIRVFMGSHALYEYQRLSQQRIPYHRDDFHVFKDCLLTLEGENSLGVWVANLKFIGTMSSRLEEAKAKGRDCKELKALLGKARAAGNENLAERYLEPLPDDNVKVKFDLQYFSTKMIMVSILTIMFEVFSVYETILLESFEEECWIESSGQGPKDISENCVKAVEQAWWVLSFAESSHMEAKRLSKAADSVFKGLKKPKGRCRWLNHNLPATARAKSIHEAVQNLQRISEKEVDISCHKEFDTINWNHTAAGAHMNSVCKKVLRDQPSCTDLEDADKSDKITCFFKNLEIALASLVERSILKTVESFNHSLIKCNDWSRLDESEICKMCIATAMAIGILDDFMHD